jgi:hypothetical protein
VNPLEAAGLVALLVLPLHCLVQWQLGREEDPAWLRRQGIVVVRDSALDGHGAEIGEYAGHRIWAGVTFKGNAYRFDRVAGLQDREKTGPGELWLDPGLVYVAI